MLGYKSPSQSQKQDILSVYQWKLWVVSLGRAVTQLQDVWVTDKLLTVEVTWQQQLAESTQSLVHNTPQVSVSAAMLGFWAAQISCLKGDSQVKTSAVKLHTWCHSSWQHSAPTLTTGLFSGFARSIKHTTARKFIGLDIAIMGRCNALLRKSIVSLMSCLMLVY